MRLTCARTVSGSPPLRRRHREVEVGAHRDAVLSRASMRNRHFVEHLRQESDRPAFCGAPGQVVRFSQALPRASAARARGGGGTDFVHVLRVAATVEGDVLKGLPRTPDSPWVFPGKKKGTRLVNLNDSWDRVRRRAGLDGIRLHDLRHIRVPCPRVGRGPPDDWRPARSPDGEHQGMFTIPTSLCH